MRIIGIDPGFSGGAALWVTGGDLNGPPRLVSVIALPTYGEDAKRRIDVPVLARWIRAMAPDQGFIERAQAMPSQGASSGFIYGRTTGALEATVACLNIPLHFVEASAWKRHYRLPGGAQHKKAAIALARQLLPGAKEFIRLQKHDGLAEAALIAHWGGEHTPTRGFFRHDQDQRAGAPL